MFGILSLFNSAYILGYILYQNSYFVYQFEQLYW